MNHWLNEGKEILGQGRSKRQMESNNKGCFITGVLLLIVLISVLCL